VHPLDAAVGPREARHGDAPATLTALLVDRVGLKHERPVRPGEAVRVLRRLGAVGEDLDRGAAFTVRVAQTVGARVAAAQDHDVLTLRRDLLFLDR
jgi:hypothetical protein